MFRTFALAAFVLLPLAAAAETVTLDTPMAGATLHQSTTDMSVYWTKAGDTFEVVGYYAARNDADDQGRIIMALADGDSVTFGLPGHIGQLYSFTREGDAVTLSTRNTMVQELALN
ncbi:hypothetical protein [Sagittula stellata]|uniref:50S ribosomal protein L33 n=1 Tax=Sagittula stellata (strain ATCC 700073 / DSM 11524 / E-37) TaxID=388399 RepID=A3JZS5_SAGS3|nr:hypothetical protein [Sagittula stellata]EBA09978.1 50S ribosomal protein L33 [Sagittula stellata E-37]